MANDELKVTDVAAWKVREAIVQLPSGNVVRLRPLRLSMCLLRGEVPNSLSSVVTNIVADGESAMERVKQKDPLKLLEMMNWIIEQCVVEPTMWNGEGERPDGSITHDDLIDSDRNMIVGYAMMGTAALTKFREI